MAHLIGYRNDLRLQTKARQDIQNEILPTLPPVIQHAAREDILKSHPSAKFRSFVSGYNCVGMVFATRRTGIDTCFVDKILDEDEYKIVRDEKDLDVGDLVIYKNERTLEVDHIGYISEIKRDFQNAKFNIMVLSAWNTTGEYFHELRDVPPSYGKTLEFRSDRNL